jgi:predicted nucleic acid-binding protein
MRIAFDTNIPVYALIDFTSAKHTATAQELLAAWAAAGNCFVSTQVLNEFLNVATRKSKPPLNEEEVSEHLRGLTVFEVVPTTPSVIEKAMHRHFSNRISFYDALIVEAALSVQVEVLFTQDLQHGARFDSLLIVDPFL